VVGDVVNTAARLEGVAPVGSVLVCEATFRATRRLFDYEPLAPVRIKGKAAPLPVWLAASARGRPGVAVDQAPATPFLGREGELDRLRRAYASARDEASVRLVTVTGEPGVGKSRLVRELRAFVDAQPELVAWRQGHCLPYGEGISFWALGEVLKSQAGILEFDGPATVAAKLADVVTAAAVEEPAERQWLETRLAPLLGLAGRWWSCSRTCTGPTTPCSPPCSGGPSTKTRPTPPCWGASAATRSTPSRSAACSTTGAPAGARRGHGAAHGRRHGPSRLDPRPDRRPAGHPHPRGPGAAA
jgi:hypothetical protein